MPFCGILVGKIEPRKLLTVGFLVCASSLWYMSGINLNAGYWDIFWPNFIQGLAMGFLFVPLTTVTHDPIPKEEMGNATSIFNVMRNIGGSIGIATTTTLYARETQAQILDLGRNVTSFSNPTYAALQGAKALFLSRGADSATATQRAYGAVFGMVQQQAAMLSFIKAFRTLGLAFLVVTPLILIMRKPRHHRGGGMAH
jgi:DHA2 family multidrug resistance protein